MPITLTKGEISQMKAYKLIHDTARTSLKLPLRYNVNLEEDRSGSTIGDLLKALDAYTRSGGVIQDEDGDKIPLVDINFD